MEERKFDLIAFTDKGFSLDVRVDPDGNTVWLTQTEMAELFDAKREDILYHLRNIYQQGELDKGATCIKIVQVQTEAGRLVRRTQPIYNLDVILSVGYRVKSGRLVMFRKWVSSVLKLRSSLDRVLSKHYWLLPDLDDDEKEDERYLQRLKRMLGKRVKVKVDRPLGSAHPLHPDIVYPVNYGYIEPMLAPDGDYQDAYVLGINKAVPSFSGVVITVIRRLDDIEGKLVVAPEGIDYSDEEILKEVAFQEQYFESVLLR